MTQKQSHANASAMLRHWRERKYGVVNPAGLEDEGPTHTLAYAGPGSEHAHRIAVTFTKVKGHPTLMHVRSTNWRYEDEPCGVYGAQACREFYRALQTAGFVKEK